MKPEHLDVKPPQACWNISGTRILKYSVEMTHSGLNEHKLVSAPAIDMLQNKVLLQAQKWDEKWTVIEARIKAKEFKEASVEEAKYRTEAALREIDNVDNILIHTLSVNDVVDWDKLKKKEKYPLEMPREPVKGKHKKYPYKPKIERPTFSFLEKYIFTTRRNRKLGALEDRYLSEVNEWEERKKAIDVINKNIDSEFEEIEINKWRSDVERWEKEKITFLQEQKDFNLKIDEMEASYLGRNPGAVVEYCDMVLDNSVYPESFPKSFELEYKPDNRILIVEYELPSIECIPRIKEVKYVASRSELKEVYLSEAEINKKFDEVMYKITLRTIHELFEADVAGAVNAITFNGWIRTINKATGQEETNCILSVQVQKDEFLGLDLSRVEPRVCFRKLKGVASSKLSSLASVRPILQIDKTDKRFIQGYDVAYQLDAATNIAAMDWEDFEHLIRELFEKEFRANGGEVKVTQSSRDGGIDAIAFDPDPIRGGKIVIQAKRYTNTVSVSAVRDLYGTVVDAGATRGILVSTADYGPDAYKFASDKPLTLLNGSNLLHLLEKHGHHAKIDLREAKRIIAEKESQSSV
ncbi:MAG: restriction endonuclease [Blastocatellales bacterium]